MRPKEKDMAKLTADERLFRKIEDKVKKAIFDYGLINDGDRIFGRVVRRKRFLGLGGFYWGAGRKSIVLGLRSW